MNILTINEIESRCLLAEKSIGYYRITPALAMEILSTRNANNRNQRDERRKKYAHDMRMGNWQVNTATIGFDKNGQLMDGQHRLAACVDAGVDFVTAVSFALDQEAAPTIDIGAARTVGDTLRLKGKKNAALLASAVHMILSFNSRKDKTAWCGKRGAVPNSAIIEFAEAPENVEALDEICSWAANLSAHTKRLYITGSQAAAMRFIFAPKYGLLFEEFITAVIKGTSLADKTPAYALRDKLLRDSRRNSIPEGELFALVSTMFLRHLKGEQNVRAVKVPDSMPEQLARNLK